VDHHLRKARTQTICKPISESSNQNHLLVDLVFDNLARRAKTALTEQVFGSGSQAVFVTRTADQRLHLDPTSDVQSSDALWRVELVPRHGEKIHPKRFYIHRYLPNRLGSIGVNQHTTPTTQVGHFGDGLQRPDLVIGEHQSHQHCIRPKYPVYIRWIDLPTSIHIHNRKSDSSFHLESQHHLQDRGMLDSRRHHVATVTCTDDTADREVVGLGTTRRKNQLVRATVEATRNLSPCAIHRTTGQTTESVA